MSLMPSVVHGNSKLLFVGILLLELEALVEDWSEGYLNVLS